MVSLINLVGVCPNDQDVTSYLGTLAAENIMKFTRNKLHVPIGPGLLGP